MTLRKCRPAAAFSGSAMRCAISRQLCAQGTRYSVLPGASSAIIEMLFVNRTKDMMDSPSTPMTSDVQAIHVRHALRCCRAAGRWTCGEDGVNDPRSSPRRRRRPPTRSSDERRSGIHDVAGAGAGGDPRVQPAEAQPHHLAIVASHRHPAGGRPALRYALPARSGGRTARAMRCSRRSWDCPTPTCRRRGSRRRRSRCSIASATYCANRRRSHCSTAMTSSMSHVRRRRGGSCRWTCRSAPDCRRTARRWAVCFSRSCLRTNSARTCAVSSWWRTPTGR